MLSGPASVPVNLSQPYNFKMRPCWPYADTVTQRLSWGDGSSTESSGAPTAWTPATHTWALPGTYGLGLTALTDSHGRRLDATTTSRDIQVTAGPGSPNLALGAAASASSTFCWGTGVDCYFASRINDGDASTVLGGFHSWANDEQTSLPQWVELDFGVPLTFRRIELYTSSGYELQNYRLEGWNGSTWAILDSVTGNILAHRTHVLPLSVSYRKLRVVGTLGPNHQTNYVRVNEVEVYAN
jgi:hypothetical protein